MEKKTRLNEKGQTIMTTLGMIIACSVYVVMMIIAPAEPEIEKDTENYYWNQKAGMYYGK